MKLQIVTDTLRSDIDLSGIAVDQVIQAFLDPEALAKYHNIRFEVTDQGDMESSNYVYSIVGNRFETPAEAKKRIGAVQKERERKKMAKMSQIQRLESQLAKLKGKS